jgi:hypothetical protein
LAWHTAIGLQLAMWHAKFVWQKLVWGLIKVHINAWCYVSGLRILAIADKTLSFTNPRTVPIADKTFCFINWVSQLCGLRLWTSAHFVCGASFLKLFTTFDLHSRISASVLQTL